MRASPNEPHGAWRRLAGHRPAAIGMAVLTAVALAAPAAPLIEIVSGGGSGGAPVAAALYAAQGSFGFALLAGLLGALGGAGWGILAVALGQRAERAMVALAERLSALPLVPGVLLVSGLAGRGLWVLAAAVALAAAPPVAALVRAELRSLLRREFLVAAQASGLTGTAILRRHVIPNAVVPVLAAAWPAFPRALAAESFASLLGLGLPDGLPSWGTALATAVRQGDPVALAAPAALLGLTLWALWAVGDGLRGAAEGAE